MIFVDTSAALALTDRGDANHPQAVESLDRILASNETLFTHSYALVEAETLIQRRIGLAQALEFHQTIMELISVHWVTEEEHYRAFELLRSRNRRGLSLVDCVSFVLMRERRCKLALAFDQDFRREGFEIVS